MATRVNEGVSTVVLLASMLLHGNDTQWTASVSLWGDRAPCVLASRLEIVLVFCCFFNGVRLCVCLGAQAEIWGLRGRKRSKRERKKRRAPGEQNRTLRLILRRWRCDGSHNKAPCDAVVSALFLWVCIVWWMWPSVFCVLASRTLVCPCRSYRTSRERWSCCRVRVLPKASMKQPSTNTSSGTRSLCPS